MPAFNSLIFSSTSLKFLSNSLKIINREIGNIQIKQINKSHKNKKINFKKEIILNNISFSYPNTNKGAIIDINLKINHGEINGLIGKSGAGKSTLVDLILGLHKASKGVITSDGIDIQTNLFSWFDLLGYVPQDIYLSDDTILNNIAYGVKPELIDLKKVKEVIKLSQLEMFVNSLPDGYNSKVGDRGRRISAGQKQRIGIARALYKNSQILILDEATSSLDHETERDFIKTIVDINKYNKVTIILIAHKLNTIKICDKLYLIKNGKLIDKGNYEYIISNHQYLNDYYKDNK